MLFAEHSQRRSTIPRGYATRRYRSRIAASPAEGWRQKSHLTGRRDRRIMMRCTSRRSSDPTRIWAGRWRDTRWCARTVALASISPPAVATPSRGAPSGLRGPGTPSYVHRGGNDLRGNRVIHRPPRIRGAPLLRRPDQLRAQSGEHWALSLLASHRPRGCARSVAPARAQVSREGEGLARSLVR
jgi:hypothetical protein